MQDDATANGTLALCAQAGLASIDERGTTCCYAKQDKFWVEGTPDGERWEIYTVLADSPSFFGAPDDGPQCCTPAATESSELAAASCC